MKTLLIMRHAKSSWTDTDIEDHERPLNKRGKRDAASMGKHLHAQNLLPDCIVGSPARRVRQTIDRLMETSGYRGEVDLYPDLYLAAPEAYLSVLEELDDTIQRPLIMGHNPGLEELLGQLTETQDSLPTGAVAQVELPVEHWADLKSNPDGRLVNLWSPKTL